MLPGRKAAEQCWGMEAIAALEACADGDTLDRVLECARFHPPSFPCLLAFFLLATSDSPTEGAEGEEA